MSKYATVTSAAHVILMAFRPMVFAGLLFCFSIREGNYGDTKLDGIDVIVAESWPKAIHEGNGTVQLYISKYATED